MGDAPKKIIVDDDWKEQARREKERLAEEAETAAAREGFPPADFVELLNLIVMQAMVGFGMVAGAGGQRIPPNLEVAKHFIDLLGVLDAKTKNNLTPEEARLLDQVLYEMRMRYVEAASGGGMAPGARGPAPGAGPAAR
jgi:hypothetical protein